MLYMTSRCPKRSTALTCTLTVEKTIGLRTKSLSPNFKTLSANTSLVNGKFAENIGWFKFHYNRSLVSLGEVGFIHDLRGLDSFNGCFIFHYDS